VADAGLSVSTEHPPQSDTGAGQTGTPPPTLVGSIPPVAAPVASKQSRTERLEAKKQAEQKRRAALKSGGKAPAPATELGAASVARGAASVARGAARVVSAEHIKAVEDILTATFGSIADVVAMSAVDLDAPLIGERRARLIAGPWSAILAPHVKPGDGSFASLAVAVIGSAGVVTAYTLELRKYKAEKAKRPHAPAAS
jgi:hypothetical protein